MTNEVIQQNHEAILTPGVLRALYDQWVERGIDRRALNSPVQQMDMRSGIERRKT